MEKLLVKGEKVEISKIGQDGYSFSMDCFYDAREDGFFDVDPFIFMMDHQNRVQKEHIIFYNNPISPCGSFHYHEFYQEGENKKNFEIYFNKLPQAMEKLVVGCSIYKKGRNISEHEELSLTLQMKNKTLNRIVFEMKDEIDGVDHEAFIFGEIYKYKDLWKFNTLKYDGPGSLLDILSKLYDIEVI